MIFLLVLIDVLLTLSVGVIVIRWIMEKSYEKGIFDLPDGERKIHQTPVPRLGGLAFFPIIAISMAILMLFLVPMMQESWQDSYAEFRAMIALAISCLILYALGLREDLKRVRGLHKFYVMTLAAIIPIVWGLMSGNMEGLLLLHPEHIFGIETLPRSIAIVVTVTAVLHMINAVNLIDGIDGLSTDICLFSLLLLGAMEAMEMHIGYMLLALAAICILLPFRYFNTHGIKSKGEKLFMGDTGCWTLGMLILFFIIHLSGRQPIHPERHYVLIGFTSMIVPLLDLPRVGIYRILHGRGPFVPDNEHIHHKLLRLGMLPYQIRSILLGITLAFVVLNMLLGRQLDVAWIIALDIVLWALLDVAISLRLRQKEN